MQTNRCKLPSRCQMRPRQQGCGKGKQAQRETNNLHLEFSWNLLQNFIHSWTQFQYLLRHLIIRSRKVSKLWNLYLELPYCSEIWQAHQQHCCRWACQISKWCDNQNHQSRSFETSQDLTIKRLIGYWNRALDVWGCWYIITKSLGSSCWWQVLLSFMSSWNIKHRDSPTW